METKHTFSINFYVKRNRMSTNKEVPIYARITINGNQVEMSLYRKIENELWCPIKGAVTGQTKNAKIINDYLQSVKTSLYEHYKRLREAGTDITPSIIKNSYLGIDKDNNSVVSTFVKHNFQVKQLVGKEYSAETHERYETCLKHLQRFMKNRYNIDDLSFGQINYQFITDFEFYFKSERNCGHNTTMKYLKNFKKIVRIALANGWITVDPFANVKMILKKVDRDYLNDEELEKLINKSFKFQRLEMIKDCFLFSCFTGLAYVDLKTLTYDNIVTGVDGKQWVFTKRKKTDNRSNIPLLTIPLKIIEKYKNHLLCKTKGVLLPVPSNQKMNAYLKEIADLCEIKKDLSSHVARHTFATTVTLNNDVPIESVSKMLGHSSINMTKIYARLLDKKVSNDMSKLYDKY